jgi:hypothetical protein
MSVFFMPNYMVRNKSRNSKQKMLHNILTHRLLRDIIIVQHIEATKGRSK